MYQKRKNNIIINLSTRPQRAQNSIIMKQINIFTLCSELIIKGNTDNQYTGVEIDGSLFSGYITLDATPEAIKDSLDDAMVQLEKYYSRKVQGLGLGDDTYYDYLPDFLDQITQLIIHGASLKVDLIFQGTYLESNLDLSYYMKKVKEFYQFVYGDNDNPEIIDPLHKDNLSYIRFLVNNSNNFKTL